MPNFLVIGSGGREHALAWRLAAESDLHGVWVAPGNPGIKRDPLIKGCLPLSPLDTDSSPFDPLKRLVDDYSIDLVVVGPEAPLAEGMADFCLVNGIKVFGPNAEAAQLETSKAFTKEILTEAGIKTADYQVFTEGDSAKEFLSTKASFPIVIKADGLAAGKGVYISHSLQDANDAIDEIFQERKFGDSGNRVVIEEFLEGPEMSFMVVTDGSTIVPLPTSRDHKRLLNNDKGPNTGGMGAITPSPNENDSLYKTITHDIFKPLLKRLKERNIHYCGFLYAGLILTAKGPYVLEFNVRMGDPETQAIMLSLSAELAPILTAATEQRLFKFSGVSEGEFGVSDILCRGAKPACCVVMASKNYPQSGGTGFKIEGLEQLQDVENVKVFYAGVGEKEGSLINSGGRVLGITATGSSAESAREEAYKAVASISWEGEQHRTDIGHL